MDTLLEQVTKNGKIRQFSPTLNEAKIKRADEIIAGVTRGDNDAVAAFRNHLGARVGENIHTTGDDFIHAFAQLTALQVDNDWEAAERDWTEVVETETFATWDTPTTYAVNAKVEGFARPQTEPDKPDHVVPIVPEGSPYPSFTFSGESAEWGGIHKAGGQYGLTFEKIVQDPVGLVPLIPKLITESLLEREQYDAWHGLAQFVRVAANELAAGETLDGVATDPNAELTRDSLAVALRQAQAVEIRGRKVNVGSYNLIVARGKKELVDYMLNSVNLTGFDVNDGVNTVRKYTFSGYNPFTKLAGTYETDYLSDDEWMLVPAKGSVRGRDKFYKLGKLRGHEGPELRIQNLTGSYLGGGSVPPFEGSFDTDSAAFRGRIIGGPVGWFNQYAVWSDGQGS